MQDMEWGFRVVMAYSQKQSIPPTLNNKTKEAQTQPKQQEPKIKEKGKKWVTFTHHSAKVRTITNLFKDTDIYNNTIQQRTKT
jgi:hypothetical protein